MYRSNDQREFARQLRNQPTHAERRLWYFLRAQKLHGRKFRRQAAIGPYIVDFVCFAHRLVIELDGPQHVEVEAAQYDQRRTDWLATRGFHILRFRNQQLDEDIHAVVAAIEHVLLGEDVQAKKPPSPALPAEGREPEGDGTVTEAREPAGNQQGPTRLLRRWRP